MAFLTALVLVMVPGVARSATAPTVAPEVPISGLDERLQLSHNSPALLVDPTRASFVVSANRLDNPEFGCTMHLSGDGGRGWIPVKPVPELPEGVDSCYAPEIAFDRTGLLYYLFIGLAGSGNTPVGAFLTTTADRGRTFTTPRKVLGSERYQVRMAMEPGAGARGRLHLVWLEAGSDPPLGGLAAPPNPIMSAWSDDGGRTFSEPVRLSKSDRRVVAPVLRLGPDGAVAVLYFDLEDDARDYQGLAGPVWDGDWSLWMSTSTDHGETFGAPVQVHGGLVPPERVMLIFTMPAPAMAVAPDGTIHVAWTDARNGDWDVFTRHSTDRGQTWSEAVRINDDEKGNGRNQYLPALAVAPNGRVDAVFLDRRDDPDNVSNNTYFASSTDGGATFGANVRLTADPSNSTIGTRYDVTSAEGKVEFGSRLALLSLNDHTLAAWPDTRNGELGEYSQDLFATEVRFRGAITKAGSAGSDDGTSPVAIAGVAALGVLLLGAAVLLARRHRQPGAELTDGA